MSALPPAGPCPVCRVPATLPFAEVAGRRYWRCQGCRAVFLEPTQRPSPAVERAHYRTHQNDPADPHYRRFLAKLAGPLCARLQPACEGLDFGCGPGPALAAMLTEAGHRVSLYDPLFHPDPSALQRAYDFVTCTEVVEHLHDPAGTFDRLAGLLRPGGWLAIMTCFQTDDARFANWHYRRDPTHVVFYREATLAHVAATRGLMFESPTKDVALLRKP
ncbi:MAG: class I SAM-dependent methyltransferase [Geminicoccaceae bacterium]|nr:MAG: class I SAM-dependent methyltransferase [Geminicoccaceae bacterium]